MYNVLLIGFQGAGKTWLLEQIRHTYLNGRVPSNRIAPTIGQNVLDLPYQKCVLHFWDLGGAYTMRKLWDQYLPDAHAIVWVLDAPLWAEDAPVQDETGGTYRESTRRSLFPIAKEAAIRGQAVVVLINKMDTLNVQHKQEEAQPGHIQEHVESYVLKEWAQFADASDNVVTPWWSFHCVSAMAAYV